MERSIVAVEENQERSNSSNGASSSLGPLVKIDSISVDLGITMEKTDEAGDKSHHFTIRSYVEKMRRKDSELCDPFSSFPEDSSHKDQPLPMATTKCRWWECHKCLRKMGKVSGDVVVNNDRTGTDLNIEDNSIGPHVIDLLIKGHDSILDDIANNQEVSQIQILNQGFVSEGHTYCAVPHQSKISKPIEVSNVAGTPHSIEYHKISSSDEEQRNLLINNQKMPTESYKHTEEAKVDKGKSIMIPFLVEKDLKTASPECEEVDNEDSGGIQKRKPQKVRLLAEILGRNEKEENSRAVSGTYSKTTLSQALEPSSTSPNMPVQDDSFIGTKRKRNVEEKKQTIEGSLLKTVGKRARILKGDEDLMKNLIMISDSDTEDITSHGGRSKSKTHGGVTISDSLKNRGMDYKNYVALKYSVKESSSSSKKKNKTPQIEESQTFFMPPRFSQNGSQKLNYDASSRMGLNLSLSGFSLSQPKATSTRHNLDLSGPSNSKKPTEAHESQRDSEDIPMEIVEFVAKNQFERALCEAEKNNGRNNHKRPNSDLIMGFPNRVKHGNRIMKIFDTFPPDIQFQHNFQNDKPEKFWSFRPPLIPEGSATNRNPEKKKEKDVRGFDLNHIALNTSNLDCPNTTHASEPWMSMTYHTPAREPHEQENDRRLSLKRERKPRKYVKHGSGPPTSLTDLGKREKLDEGCKQAIVSPIMLTSRTEYCSLNRNPADFTNPGNHNQFMISGEQLGFSKK